MDYIKYRKLGFKRTNMNDNIEKNKTGYGGFVLSKQINDKMSVQVCSSELDKPKLYIKKNKSETYHIVCITTDIVMDFFSNELTYSDFYTTVC